VIVTRIDRLARSTFDLFAIVKRIVAGTCMGGLVSRDFRWHQLRFGLSEFLCSVGEPFLHPGLHFQSEPRGAAVNIGRRPPPEAARSSVDGCEHGAMLDQVGFTVLLDLRR
jgi:hypothetical protein